MNNVEHTSFIYTKIRLWRKESFVVVVNSPIFQFEIANQNS